MVKVQECNLRLASEMSSTKMPMPQRVRDPVNNLIEFGVDKFESACWEVVRTPQFQRLRRVKQLGFSDLVYPGATHSRLAHSLGVFDTARKLVGVINKIQGTASDSRRACTAIAAALVHDVGHGPFSHAFEDVLRDLGLGKHEVRSVRLIKETEISDALEQFTPGFATDVAKVIEDPVPQDIYAAIVSSQFDADRLDYMRRDRLMTGTRSSDVDFEWLLANLHIRRVTLGQDETAVKEIETLVVGPKALLAAESYVVSLFHLYPNVYFHKTTRGAEKMFSALLKRIGQLVLDGSIHLLGIQAHHPIVKFFQDPENLEIFLDLDDASIWGALPELRQSSDACVSQLSEMLSRRDLYKVVDVGARIYKDFPHDVKERKEREAKIRAQLRDSDLLNSNESAPLALQDVAIRNPYKRMRGDEEGALQKIHVVDRSGNLADLGEVSPAVKNLEPFEAYRIYYRPDDADTRSKLDSIIEGNLK